jgi:hypothetical protein
METRTVRKPVGIGRSNVPKPEPSSAGRRIEFVSELFRGFAPHVVDSGILPDDSGLHRRPQVHAKRAGGRTGARKKNFRRAPATT